MPRIELVEGFWLVTRKGTARWYVEWSVRGEKRRVPTGTADLTEAKDRARDIILNRAEIRGADPMDLAVVDVLDRYRLQYGEGLASRETIRRACDLWGEFWGDRSVSAITPQAQDDFRDWLEDQEFSEGYARRVLGVGQAALNRAFKRGEIRQVPHIELPPIGEAFPHFATDAQLVVLLNALPDHLFTYALIRLTTGCRGDAALDLQPFQVDGESKLIRLNPPGRRQTKKYRAVVPLTDTLAAHLKTLPAASHLVNWQGRKVASIRTSWRQVRAEQGLPEWFVPKVLRHTVATHLRRKGVPGWEVSGLLGHTGGGQSAKTTEVYAKFDPAYLSRAREVLDAWMGELSQKVPRLRGVSPGPVVATGRLAESTESRVVTGFQVVGGTGFEPVTPTMSRSRK